MVIEQILVGHMAVFCYLIGDEESGEAVLVDPASDFDRIMTFIEKYNFTIKKIINTHGHFDHIGGNRYFIKKTGAELLIHERDYFFLNKSVSRFLEFIRGGRAVKFDVRFIDDGDQIPVGKHTIKVIHTPGHSPGSICLYVEGNLFTGDTLFTEGTGRTDFKGGCQDTIMDSIRNRILSLPDETIIWPGHHYGRFPVSTVKEQKRYYL
ncbi:MAG TPA: MBL fold metallo-hydrolase [Spirochaetota bacterium]|nr:MBL fold metallo-hydrolase [Spirochaetota bacterium]HPF05339.1 MBL fold metallo-hydrolase [Spirochaetota bacterium]HPJ41769.1 MBL fold metallo-hydrolase [Spirochaetota bacterium]HPR39214.1 MBL fold metallo-hydrolase [Spirochaetota bacterium]HRX46991.1 MBL fold metallo-hydrolase [Spirochaetota bacterium]